MARLRAFPKTTLQRDLPDQDKMKLALEFLRENPHEKPSTAARLYYIVKEDSVRKAWLRERTKKKTVKGGQNKILRPEQHQAMIQYAVDQAIDGGKGATKQMMYNCAMWLRVQEHKSIPSWRWFQLWLKNTPELHTIKTKPIASHCVDIHTEKDLRDWFMAEYKPAIEYTNIQTGKYIHNMDEKGARIACPAGEEVVVPTGIKEIYVGVPENRLSLTIIESISADRKAIPPVVIVPGVTIMVSWFHENMTGHEVITVSPSGYTNEGICITWLDHFIKHNNCGPDKPWHILLIDGATCHKAPDFVLKAKMNHIWVVKFPSHQTHLIQPLDVGCFRQWKHYQQSTIMNAIRSFEAEYNIQSFFRDLPKIRAKTFTKRTIKHSFQNSGIWPISFKAVKKKLKEYGKKQKKDIGLDFLEYGSESESESESEINSQELIPVPDPQLMEEYQLPKLKPPTSYDECRFQLQELDPKIQAGISSPTRAKYSITIQATNVFLMQGSLHEMEIAQAHTGAVETHKRKLQARKSLQKGGSLLASDALQKIKDKKRKEADENLKRARTAITRAENKAKNELHAKGVQARKDEKARLQFIQEHHVLGSTIPDYYWLPIRDPEKNPTSAETEALRANQSLYDAVKLAEEDWKVAYLDDPTQFTLIPIDPAILEEEQQYQLQQRKPLEHIVIQEDSEDEGDGSGSNIISPPQSVASIDSIAENADFISFE